MTVAGWGLVVGGIKGFATLGRSPGEAVFTLTSLASLAGGIKGFTTLGLVLSPDSLKGLAVAARVGGPAALEALWKAMESDPSKSVRLYAFRAMSGVNRPELVLEFWPNQDQSLCSNSAKVLP